MKISDLFIKGKTKILLLVLIVAIPFQAGSQSREGLLKAGYIEKFVHFVEWPVNKVNPDQKQTISICILGDDPIFAALQEIISKSGSKTIEYTVQKINSLDELQNCKLLFISGSVKSNIEEILSHTSGKPILTIGDTKGFCEKGVIINLFQEGNYIRYEVNRKSLNRSGLIINSILLNYAVIKG